MRQLLLPLLFFLAIAAHAQQPLQWAAEVVSFSSQHGEKYYSATQALGVPNAISEHDLSPWAWVPKRDDSGSEYIRVRFASGQRGVRQVYVSESYNPGAISAIYFFDTNGKRHKVYENKEPRSPGYGHRFRMFKTSFPPTDYHVVECMVELKTKAVPGSNHIDAIGISNEAQPLKIKAQIDNLQYSEEPPRPENLGPYVNSAYAERLPIISPDGNTLYFTRKLHPQNTGGGGQDDIWVSRRLPDGSWGTPRNVGPPLNTPSHNFVVSVNPTGNRLYLGNDYETRAKDGVSVSTLRAGRWQDPKRLDILNHYNNNDFVEYHLSVDETVLILSVEREGGFGERDLHVAFRQNDGSWSEPKNLGGTVNTVNIESSPFLAADGKTLYFAGNGHYTYGGLDVFMVRRLDDTWTRWTSPKNLGPLINTADNDFNYTIPASGEYAYFSSAANSHGMSDLFRIKLPEEARPEPVMLVSGKVIDASTNTPIQAKIKYKPLGKPSQDHSADANEDGSYQMVLTYGDNVEVYADIEGYFPVSESMELADSTLEELDSDGDSDTSPSDEPSPEEQEALAEIQRLEAEIADLKARINEGYDIVPQTHDSSGDDALSGNNDAVPYGNPNEGTDGGDALTGNDNAGDGQDDSPYDDSQDDMADDSQNGDSPTGDDNPTYAYQDRELEALRAKYNQQFGGSPKSDPFHREDPSGVSDKFNKHKDETSRPDPTGVPRRDDAERDRLADKFNKFKEQDSRPDPNLPPKEDKDRDALADKFNGKPADTPTDENSADDLPVDDTPADEPVAEDTPIADTPADDAPSFEELEARARAELKEELAEQVRAELRKELMEEVKEELEGQSDDGGEAVIIEEVVAETEREAFRELEGIPSLGADVSNDSPMEDQIKVVIREQVKEELKEEIEEGVKEELKDEIAMKVKEKEADEARERLEAWKARRNSTSDNRPQPQPEPAKEPEYVELKQDIQVVPIKVGQVIPMNNIFFDANKSSIKEQSDAELQRVLAFLQSNANLVVEVGGHTNGWCSSTFAHELSSERAKAVRQYFIDSGVPEARIQYRGYGKTAPIADNNTVAGRKKNQRVELKILQVE